MHVNKVSHVRTINLVDKGPEDGLIWVQGLDDESVMAFTDFGFDSLVGLIKIHRETMPRYEC